MSLKAIIISHLQIQSQFVIVELKFASVPCLLLFSFVPKCGVNFKIWTSYNMLILHTCIQRLMKHINVLDYMKIIVSYFIYIIEQNLLRLINFVKSGYYTMARHRCLNLLQKVKEMFSIYR
jgi:hypothetical protein